MPLPFSRTLLLWVLATLFLSGCATTATQISTQPKTNAEKPSVLHKQHMENIAKIQDFSLKGRLGIKTKPKSFSARLAWQHTSEKDNIDVYSPLGGKVANIVKTPEEVTLIDNSKKSIKAKDIEALTEKALGFRLPLSGLSHWALGRPNNQGIVNAMTWDQNGRISTLQQNGWDILYKEYKDNEGYFLPRKVTLKNESMTLKLIVDKWSESLTIK
ncbi:MAG: lipoprotein insertase outer membrane protein LolB [Methylophilaceae bacterium]